MDAAKQLRKYAESLQSKTENLVQELGDYGWTVQQICSVTLIQAKRLNHYSSHAKEQAELLPLAAMPYGLSSVQA